MRRIVPGGVRPCRGLRTAGFVWGLGCGVAVLQACSAQAQFSFVTNNNELTLTGYVGAGGDVAIPDSSFGLAVTAIAPQACWFNNNLLNLTVTNTALAVGDLAFYRCDSLTNVTLGAGVTNIGLGAFEYDPSLLALKVDPLNPNYSSLDGVLFDKRQTTLVQCPGGLRGSYRVPDTVTTLGSNAFYYCTAIASVVLPDTVTDIQDSAFSNCGMTNIVLSTNLGSIGGSAFLQSGLRSITLPASVTNLGFVPFRYCLNLPAIGVDPANPAYSSVDGVLLDKAQRNVVQCPPGKSGSFSLPPTVTNIGTYAFAGSRLTTLVVPDGLLTVGDWSFSGGGPKDLDLPDSLVSIGPNAFYVSPLTNVTFGTGLTNLGDYALSQCSFLGRLRFRGNAPTLSGSHVFYSDGAGTGRSPTVYYVPGTTGWGATFGGLPTVPWDPVSQCTVSNWNNTFVITGYIGASNSVSVPASISGLPVVAIADSAFYQNPTLTNVSLPPSVTKIGNSAFYNCTALRAIQLSGVTNIGNSAFYNCTSLREVSFGPNLSAIGQLAFYNCFNLRSRLVIPAGVSSLYAVFDGCTNLTSLFFLGNAPATYVPFTSDATLTVYYLPGTAGWTNTLAGRPAVLWNPQATQAALHPDGFSFKITGSSNLVVVVETCTNLSAASWSPLATNLLANGVAPFNDAGATNLPARYYRFRSP